MVKRIFVILVLGILIGSGAFLIQVKRGIIKVQNPSQNTLDEQVITPTPTEEEVLKGDIGMTLTKVGSGDRLELESVKLILPGFVVVFDDEGWDPKNVIGTSELINSGESKKVAFKLKRKLLSGEKIFLGLHTDDGNGVFDGATKDIPVMTRGSIPVRKEIKVGF